MRAGKGSGLGSFSVAVEAVILRSPELLRVWERRNPGDPFGWAGGLLR